MASVSVRSYLAAGVAAVGVGAVALSPVQPVSTAALAPQYAADLAVNLAATIDPITPIVTTIETTFANISGLVETYFARPLPIVQQVVENVGTYVGELPDFGLIAEQAFGNIGNAIEAPFNADLSTLDTLHRGVFTLLPTVAPIPQGVLDFTASTAGGLLLGLLGPVLAPVAALVDSVTSIIHAVEASDFGAAINDLINIPTAMINAFLNGGPAIGLTSLLGGLIPPDSGATLNSASLVLGGLFSQGASIFNALAVDTSVQILPEPLPPTRFDVPAGPPAGIFGALTALTNGIATAIKVTPPTPPEEPAPTAAVRPAAADALPEAEVAEIAAPVAQDGAPDAQVEVTSVGADEPVALTAERAEDAPAPVQHRQSRRGAAAAGGEKASPTRGSAAAKATAKAASAGRSAR